MAVSQSATGGHYGISQDAIHPHILAHRSYGHSASPEYGLPTHDTTSLDVVTEGLGYKTTSVQDVPNSPASDYAEEKRLTQDVPPSSAYKKIHNFKNTGDHVGQKTSRRKNCKHPSHSRVSTSTTTTTTPAYMYAPTTSHPSARFSVDSISHPHTLPAIYYGAAHAPEHIQAGLDTTIGGHPTTPVPAHLHTTSADGHIASMHGSPHSHSIHLSHPGAQVSLHIPEHTTVAPHPVTHVPVLHEASSLGHGIAPHAGGHVSEYTYSAPASHVTEYAPTHPHLTPTAHPASQVSKHPLAPAEHPHILTTTTTVRHGAAHISSHHTGPSVKATTVSYPGHIIVHDDHEVSHLTDAHTKAVHHLVASHRIAHSGSLAACKHFHATKNAAHAHVTAVHQVASAHKRMHTGAEFMNSGKASYISPKGKTSFSLY